MAKNHCSLITNINPKFLIMKKTLLSLFAALACVSAATAAEVTFDFTTAGADGKIYGFTPNNNASLDDGSLMTNGAASITIQTATINNGVRVYGTSPNCTLRVYNSSGFTVSVSGGNITEIAFTGKVLTAITYGADKTPLSGASSASWTGNAASVEFANTVKDAKGKNQTVQITKMVITYTPTGTQKNVAELSFPEKAYTVAIDKTFDNPVLTCNSDGEVTYSSSDQKVATVDESTGEITLEGIGTTTITAISAETATYYEGKAQYTLTVTGKMVTARKAAAMEAGKYFLMRGEQVATPFAADQGYGYLVVENCTVDGSDVTAPESNLFDFAKEGDNYTIKDCYGRYLYLDDSHMSFNASETATGNYLWNVTIDEQGNGTITNVGRPTITVAWSEKYSNFSVAENPTADLMPVMYIYGGSSSIDNINSDSVDAEEGTAVYYNLQGARVENPSNGVYIRVINNKAEKVIL